LDRDWDQRWDCRIGVSLGYFLAENWLIEEPPLRHVEAEIRSAQWVPQIGPVEL